MLDKVEKILKKIDAALWYTFIISFILFLPLFLGEKYGIIPISADPHNIILLLLLISFLSFWTWLTVRIAISRLNAYRGFHDNNVR